MPPTATSPQSSPPPQWAPLAGLRARFEANLAVLAGRSAAFAQRLRDLQPTQDIFICARDGSIAVGTRPAGAGSDVPIQPVPVVLSAPGAAALATKIFPDGACKQPVLVAGEDMGWLWNALHSAPCQVASMPKHRPPLFFLIADLQQLWIILHVQQWAKLLADPRVQLFAGNDAFEQFRNSLNQELMLPWPRVLVTVGAGTWPPGLTIDDLLQQASVVRQEQLAELERSWRVRTAAGMRLPDASATEAAAGALAAKIATNRPLRVLGVTSRYTTFLQHSMRDWLAAFERLGHGTQLLIESADHEVPSPLALPTACARFQPDLVVCVDHCRRTLGQVPPEVPVVMWVQDRLPHIYSRETGAAQGRFDYTIGHSRSELTQRFGYPKSRFMPAMLAVNESRFSPARLSTDELNRYRCEVSFVTNCTRPASQIVAEQIQQIGSPEAKRLFDAVYQRLEAIYQAGGAITSGDHLRKLIQDVLIDTRLNADAEQLMHLFQHGVNNALFRHQAVRWVAEMGVDLHLYGGGWEQNPEFARYARGIADNRHQLPIIYRASAINLQVTPYGAVHQRLLDGLAAGGFFLLRSVSEDRAELLLRDLWEWARRRGVARGAEMLRQRDEELDRLVREYQALLGADLTADPDHYLAGAEEVVLSGLTRTPNTLWPGSERVTFSSREQLQEQVRHFLAAPAERAEIAALMRQRVLETHTYQSVVRRMLAMIAADLKTESSSRVASAMAA